MNVPNETLDQAAARLFRQQTLLAAAMRQLRAADAPVNILADLDAAATIAQTTQNALVRAGAADPLEAARADTRDRMRAAGLAAPEPTESLHRLTPAAIAAVEALDRAAQAYSAYDAERGIADGIAEVLTDYAAAARLEAYGPPELARHNP